MRLPQIDAAMLKSFPRMSSPIKSAGCLIIGDEVLNGKIRDSNSYEFAKYCFNTLAVPLKKTIVCGDDREDIIRSLQSLRDEKCDFIVTSGGIGSTHDDITYDAIAEAFGVPCVLDNETVNRMRSIRGEYLNLLSKEQLHAFYRMATLPQLTLSVTVLKLYTASSMWVPIVGVQDQVYILPGVPELFKKLMVGLGDHLKPRISLKSYSRVFVQTATGESSLAPFLSALQDKCDANFGRQQIKLGSYPHFTWKLVTISIIGENTVPDKDLLDVVNQVMAGVGGSPKIITSEEEDFYSTHEKK